MPQIPPIPFSEILKLKSVKPTLFLLLVSISLGF
jgi:hypothetical protein